MQYNFFYMDVPQIPPAAPPPPPPKLPKISLNLDLRTFDTLKWSAVWNGVGGAILTIASFRGGLQDFPVGQLISNMLWGAVYGAVFGFLISKFYTQIQTWNRQYLKGRLNTFFKLLFYPSLAGSLFAFFGLSPLGRIFGFLPFLFILAGIILKSFIYAKMMTKYVGQFYPHPPQA